MKTRRSFMLASALLALTAFPAGATDGSFGARVSAGVDYKIDKGLHLKGEEELRFDGSGFDRSYTTARLSYKVCDYFAVAGGYSLIANGKTNATGGSYMDWKHRGFLDLTGTLRYGNWRFQLRERFQMTYDSEEINNYQKPQTAMELKSRLMVSYKDRRHGLTPFAYAEMKHMLNGAKWSEQWDTADYESATWIGHTDAYMKRMRFALGTEWAMDRHNAIEIYCLYDLLWDKQIDARKESNGSSNTLKGQVSTTRNNRFSVGVGYVFSF